MKKKSIIILSLALIAGLFCFIACNRNDKTKNQANGETGVNSDIVEGEQNSEETEIDSNTGKVETGGNTGETETSTNTDTKETSDAAVESGTGDKTEGLEAGKVSDSGVVSKDTDKQQTSSDTKADSKKDDSNKTSEKSDSNKTSQEDNASSTDDKSDSKKEDSQTQKQPVDKPVDNTVLTVDMDEVDEKCKYYTKELKDLAYTVLKSLYIKDNTAFYSYPEVVEPYHISVEIQLFLFDGIGTDTVFRYQSDDGWLGGTPYDNTKRDVSLDLKLQKPLSQYSATLELRIYNMENDYFQIYDVMWRDTGEYSFLSEEEL